MAASFEITEIADLLDSDPLRINKLAKSCRIKPSIDHGGGQGHRRRYSIRDVCRFGLALWLWRAGLRGPAMDDALGRMASRTLLSGLERLRDIQAEAKEERFLVATGFRGLRKGYERVTLVASLDRAQTNLKDASGVVVPVGRHLKSLAERIEKLRGL